MVYGAAFSSPVGKPNSLRLPRKQIVTCMLETQIAISLILKKLPDKRATTALSGLFAVGRIAITRASISRLRLSH